LLYDEMKYRKARSLCLAKRLRAFVLTIAQTAHDCLLNKTLQIGKSLKIISGATKTLPAPSRLPVRPIPQSRAEYMTLANVFGNWCPNGYTCNQWGK